MRTDDSDAVAYSIVANTATANEILARMLARDLAPIGDVTVEPRLSGFALLEDGVMFAFVDADSTVYLRVTAPTAQLFHELGSRKHPVMRYWTIPNAIAADIELLREAAYEAADMAHLALSFGIDDRVKRTRLPFGLALLAV